MRLTSGTLRDGQPLPDIHAFCVPDPSSHARPGPNRNPQLEWGDLPEGTRSLALLCIDSDVPSRPDDVNREGREIPRDLARVEFAHWVVVDIPPDRRSISEGEFSDGVTPRGKPGSTDRPREGLNDFTSWFADDPEMAGVYKGYDGPCPPWNDSIVHRYRFTLHALDIDVLPVDGDFTADEVVSAMQGHELAQASLTVTYSLNPSLR